MSALQIKTLSEQRLEWLQSLKRPLTDEESDMLRRSLHAVYCRNRVLQIEARNNRPILDQHRKEELEMLAKAERELAPAVRKAVQG